jgi:hypothetical protein
MTQLSINFSQNNSEADFYENRLRELTSLWFSLLYTNPSAKQQTEAFSHQYVATWTDRLSYASVWQWKNPNTWKIEIWKREASHALKERVRETAKIIRMDPSGWIVDKESQNTLDGAA